MCATLLGKVAEHVEEEHQEKAAETDVTIR